MNMFSNSCSQKAVNTRNFYLTFVNGWTNLILSTSYPYYFISETILSGETIRRAKFSSPNEKFVTFARRKSSPNKSKSVVSWSTSEPKRESGHLDKLWLSCWAKLCRARFPSGEIIRRARFSSLFKKFASFALQSFAR